MGDSLLSVDQLSLSFSSKSGDRAVIENLSFEVAPSECVALVGESGSGKSLTALAIMQLLPYGAYVAKESAIRFHELGLLDCTEQHMRAIRGKRIGMIFQDSMSAFNPVLTIKQQMNEVLNVQYKRKKDRQNKALSLLDEVGIKQVKHCYHAYPHQLSGGMRQRAMIAMALCGHPELIIADEPTTALDVTIQAQVIDLLLDLRDKNNLTMLFISHDLAVVSQIADQVVVMKSGKCVEKNTARVFFQNPQSDYALKLLNAIPPATPRQSPLVQSSRLLSVDHLKMYFQLNRSGWFSKRDVVKAVDDVSLQFFEGKTLALVGESGSGKTTLAKLIIRLLSPTAGQILFQDKDLSMIKGHSLKLMRQDIQILFQDPYVSLNPRRTVGDSIIEGMAAQKILTRRKEQISRVDELLDMVGLNPSMKWRYPHQFSGGERQRLCLARALALKPKLLILDEPTSALDVSIQMQMLALLESLQKTHQLSYLLITHNISVVAYLSHSIAVMYHGKIVEQGDTAELLAHPQHDYTKQLLAAVPTITDWENPDEL